MSLAVVRHQSSSSPRTAHPALWSQSMRQTRTLSNRYEPGKQFGWGQDGMDKSAGSWPWPWPWPCTCTCTLTLDKTVDCCSCSQDSISVSLPGSTTASLIQLDSIPKPCYRPGPGAWTSATTNHTTPSHTTPSLLLSHRQPQVGLLPNKKLSWTPDPPSRHTLRHHHQSLRPRA